MTELLDQVKIPVGDRYVVAISKDHNKGVVVQVARMNPTHVSSDRGVVSIGHQPVILWQRILPIVKITGKDNSAYKALDLGGLPYKDEATIEGELKPLVVEACAYAMKCNAGESGLDNVLTKLKQEYERQSGE